MAEQPEDEAEVIVRFQQRDDNQPSVDYGNIDKGHVITGEPIELMDVVDKAVDMARRYMHAPDLLGKMVDDIEKYLERKTMCQLAEDPDIPLEVWMPLDDLITETVRHYNATLRLKEASDAIYELLQQFCLKVKGIRFGCLIVELKLNEEKLIYLVKFLDYIARQVKRLVYEDLKLKEQVTSILQSSRFDHPTGMREVLPQLFMKLHDLARIQVSIPKQQMLDLLDGLSDTVELTIYPVLKSSKPAPDDEEAEQRKILFLQAFQRNEAMYKALQYVFDGAEMAQHSLEQSFQQMELTGVEAEKEEAHREYSKTQEFSKLDMGSDVEAKGAAAAAADDPNKDTYTVFIGDLKDGSDERYVLNLFREFGTISYITLARKPGNYRGYVRFVSKSSAAKAVHELKREVHYSLQPEPPVQKRTTDTIEIKDLPALADRGYLEEMCGKYGSLEYARVIPGLSKGYVKFSEDSAALKALTDLQSEGMMVFMARPPRKHY